MIKIEFLYVKNIAHFFRNCKYYFIILLDLFNNYLTFDMHIFAKLIFVENKKRDRLVVCVPDLDSGFESTMLLPPFKRA